MKHIFDIYSEQTLSFKLEGLKQAADFVTNCDIEKLAVKHLSYAERSGATSLIIFGAADGKLTEKIAKLKPKELFLITCDLYPETIQQLKSQDIISTINTSKNYQLVDSSIWAHLLLLFQSGFTAKNSHLVLNPCIQGENKKKHQNLQKLFSGCSDIQLPEKYDTNIQISAGAILSPNEPELNSFISSFPEWLKELILIWDCSSPEEIPRICCDTDIKIVNVCHKLNGDFAAQRSIMLEHCSSEWVIYLDADERLSSEHWNQLKSIGSYKSCDGWYFPRMTFYPDKEHCRMGYGLWPDLQLRFFRKSPAVKFINKIHEKLTGLTGQTGILVGSPIKHLTHLLKNRNEIKLKLSVFNEASSGNLSHRLGAEFPYIRSSLLEPQKESPLKPVILPKINL